MEIEMKQAMIKEVGYSLKGTRIGWVDYNYFHDLFDKNALTPKSEAELNDWVTNTFSVISSSQAAPNKVNKPVLTGEKREFSRPISFGRVAVIETEVGPFEVKGIGVRPEKKPNFDRHGTGLISLQAGMCEVCVEVYIRDLLKENLGVSTVKFVAVILTDIQMYDSNSTKYTTRCAILVREHFPRFSTDLSNPMDAFQILEFFQTCEQTLREYGLTTAFPETNLRSQFVGLDKKVVWRDVTCPSAIALPLEKYVKIWNLDWQQEWDLINIQACLDTSKAKLLLVDFGGYEFRENFEYPIVNGLMGRVAHIEEKLIFEPNGRFVAQSSGLHYQGIISLPKRPSQPCDPILRKLKTIPSADHKTDLAQCAELTKVLALEFTGYIEKFSSDDIASIVSDTIRKFIYAYRNRL